MDPDANLEEQLKLAQSIVDDMPVRNEWEEKANRLAELVLALDGWMARGGFPPKAWKASKT